MLTSDTETAAVNESMVTHKSVPEGIVQRISGNEAVKCTIPKVNWRHDSMREDFMRSYSEWGRKGNSIRPWGPKAMVYYISRIFSH